MKSRVFRIRTKSDWEQVSAGKTYNFESIWFRYFLSEDKDLPPKLGFAISKKYGNAVARNKFKRRAREIVFKNQSKNAALNGTIILVGTKKTNGEMTTYVEMDNAFSAFISSLK